MQQITTSTHMPAFKLNQRTTVRRFSTGSGRASPGTRSRLNSRYSAAAQTRKAKIPPTR
ncbi:MAG: hypothetical protein LBV60_09820 [Streptomyces sp.]|nr:hypothetical protein [Streptomyces sp.]